MGVGGEDCPLSFWEFCGWAEIEIWVSLIAVLVHPGCELWPSKYCEAATLPMCHHCILVRTGLFNDIWRVRVFHPSPRQYTKGGQCVVIQISLDCNSHSPYWAQRVTDDGSSRPTTSGEPHVAPYTKSYLLILFEPNSKAGKAFLKKTRANNIISHIQLVEIIWWRGRTESLLPVAPM